MAKQQKAATAENQAPAEGGEGAPAAAEAKKGGQGSAAILPNGQRRIDYIRDHYYAPEGSAEKMTRSQIKNAINEMYKNAGEEDKIIAYQIVFQATKTKEDPRKAKPAAAPAGETAAA